MLLELEKVKPDTIEIEKMMHIPRSEYNDLKSQSKSPARTWVTEKVIAGLEAALDLKSRPEQSALIAIDGLKTQRALAEKYTVARQENIELKKRLAELQPAP